MSLLRKLLPFLVLTTLLTGSSADVERTPLEVKLGTLDYVEWQHGDAPIIISVPHGGGLRPDQLPDRGYGKTARDSRTAEIGHQLRKAIYEATGKTPHLVLCHLHRSKLDANREIREAAQGASDAETAWTEYHEFIDQARAQVVKDYGQGLYVDLHGQSHSEGWIEWGYTLSSKSLATSKLKGPSSIDHLARVSELSLAELISGSTSLGGRSQALGYESVPSPAHVSPEGGQYFSGGYSTKRHGSSERGTIDGVQLELPRRLRANTAGHPRLCRDLAQVLVGFLNQHYEIDWVESE